MRLFPFSRFSNLLLIACSAVVLETNVVSAQVSRGEFTLSVETHWGRIVMPLVLTRTLLIESQSA